VEGWLKSSAGYHFFPSCVTVGEALFSLLIRGS
jgi:hypothetical protein